MKTIEIKTQQEFDALLTSYDEFTRIHIKTEQTIIIRTIPKNSHVKALDNSHVKAWDNSHVQAWGNSYVEALGNSHVEAWDNSHVGAWGNSYVEAGGNSYVKAWGNSHVEAWGNSHVEAWDNSHVGAWGNSHVEAWDNSHVKAWGNSHVEALGNSHVKAWGNSHVEALGNSHVQAWGNTIIRVLNQNVEISLVQQQAIIVYQNCKGKPKHSAKTVSVIYKNQAKFEWKNFVSIFDVEIKNKKIILIKSVKEDLTDHYTGTIKHEIGKWMDCPDWDSNIGRECGGGWHLSPSIEYCKRFNKGRYLKCEVPLYTKIKGKKVKNILVHPKPNYPFKIRCKKIKPLEEVFDS